jgi:hypothetical protein
VAKIMAEGGLVPFELTVQILINGMINRPAKVSRFYYGPELLN